LPFFLNHVFIASWIAGCSPTSWIRSVTSHSLPAACSV
jgi:hypothetical protein